MDLNHLDDEAILGLITQARQDALGELYDRYSRLVFSLALYAVGDPGSAEEVTQDVFMRVWEKAGTYRPEQAKVTTWISSITRYRAIDLLRRQKIRPEGSSVGWDEAPPGELVADQVDPEAYTELEIDRRRVRQAISSLPVDQQSALALAYFQGMSHSEIAEALGEPLGTIKTRIRLGMQKLREQLGEEHWQGAPVGKGSADASRGKKPLPGPPRGR